MQHKLVWTILSVVLIAKLALAGAIVLGTGPKLPEMKSVNSPFASVDFSRLPPLERMDVPKGSPLAFRRYGKPDKGVLVAIHGSTATSASLHPLAMTAAKSGFAVYVPDMRGHGGTGQRGDVDFTGQPDLDILALIERARQDNPGKRVMLAGFSLGGGFALRFLGKNPQARVDAAFLLSPALGRLAPTLKAGGDQWASPHIPRIIALTFLNRAGIHALDGLEVVTFAINPAMQSVVTGHYSHRLRNSLMPEDYRADFRNLKVPVHVLIGEEDELFDAKKMPEALHDVGGSVSLTRIPGIDHIALTLAPAALEVLVKILEKAVQALP